MHAPSLSQFNTGRRAGAICAALGVCDPFAGCPVLSPALVLQANANYGAVFNGQPAALRGCNASCAYAKTTGASLAANYAAAQPNLW